MFNLITPFHIINIIIILTVNTGTPRHEAKILTLILVEKSGVSATVVPAFLDVHLTGGTFILITPHGKVVPSCQ